MIEIYKVTVERVKYDDSGEWSRSETLFEAASPNASRLVEFAPDEVHAALSAELGEVNLIPDAIREHMTATLVPVEGHVAPLVEPAAPAAGTEAPATRRKRRTKAEIEADRAREAASATPAASRPDNFGAQVVADTEAARAVAMTATAEAPATVPAAPPATPQAPYNPFAPQ